MSSRGGLLPNLGARGAMTRSSGASDTAGSDSPAYTLLNGSLDASGALDLFGGARRGLAASQARLQAAQASWDEARVTLAAGGAEAYVQRRCRAHQVGLVGDTPAS